MNKECLSHNVVEKRLSGVLLLGIEFVDCSNLLKLLPEI